MAFADVSDVAARWRALDANEQEKASVLLCDASAMLSKLVDVDFDDARQMAILKSVCCSMVIRAMSASQSDTFGLSQTTMTAGPYSQSASFANPSGDMYLTKMERKLLGINAAVIGTIPPVIGGAS